MGKSKAERLRDALLNTVSAKDVRDITQTLIRLAKEGDLKAAELILTRALGKPKVEDKQPSGPLVNLNIANQTDSRATALEILKRLRDERTPAQRLADDIRGEIEHRAQVEQHGREHDEDTENGDE